MVYLGDSMTAEEFGALFRAHIAEISRFLVRRLPADQVEDMASDLFEIAWRKRGSIPKDFELPWLYKTARYLISNYRRKEAGRTSILASLSEPTAAPSAESIALADIELAEAWTSLPAKEQEVLAMWSMDGMEPDQISKALGISTNAVNIRLHRAKKNLLALLEKNSNPAT
jgi:RNA polymerase sigma-70 factor (ECF subfamily)